MSVPRTLVRPWRDILGSGTALLPCGPVVSWRSTKLARPTRREDGLKQGSAEDHCAAQGGPATPYTTAPYNGGPTVLCPVARGQRPRPHRFRTEDLMKYNRLPGLLVLCSLLSAGSVRGQT
jgi:hypothetical protein